MIRTFVALKIPVSNELADAVNVLKIQLSNERINWVPLENMHVTLLFIGSVSQQEVGQIIGQLRSIKHVVPFSFQLQGLDVFKKAGKPRVIFSKVDAGAKLEELAISVRHALTGFYNEKAITGFSPHLTLGRVKSIRNSDKFETVLFDFRNTYFQKVDCAEFVLYESILTPQGPIYTPIEIFSFK